MSSHNSSGDRLTVLIGDMVSSAVVVVAGRACACEEEEEDGAEVERNSGQQSALTWESGNDIAGTHRGTGDAVKYRSTGLMRARS